MFCVLLLSFVATQAALREAIQDDVPPFVREHAVAAVAALASAVQNTADAQLRARDCAALYALFASQHRVCLSYTEATERAPLGEKESERLFGP